MRGIRNAKEWNALEGSADCIGSPLLGAGVGFAELSSREAKRGNAVRGLSHLRVAAICGLGAIGLAACDASALPEKPIPLVRATTVEVTDFAPTIVLTGEIRPRVESELSFRTSGRIIERNVDVGTHVMAGDVLARIDPKEQEANLDAAEAAVTAAEASYRQTFAVFKRQEALLQRGFTTRRDYDAADKAFRLAKGSLDAAAARLAAARDQLSYTTLRAGITGIVTARTVEVGEVVQAAAPILTIAEDGPRDAVFRVPEAVLSNKPPSKTFTIALVSDPSVTAEGVVREIAPTVDASAGTITVKVGLDAVPEAMSLGAAVAGNGQLPSHQGVTLPWTALSSDDGKPAVWIVDPTTNVVSLKPVTIGHYGSGIVVIGDGLAEGEIVVTTGAQLLRPGQRVALATGGSK